jgi:RNA polymerase sigma factor (sigma-70 family)
LVKEGMERSARESSRGQLSFDDVFDASYPAMVRVAYLSLGSRAIAEEVVQEAFLRLHRHFDEVTNPGAYLRTTVVRLCISTTAREAVEADRLARVDVPGSVQAHHVDETWDVLRALTPERRVVLVLRYYHDLSDREIAEIIGRPVATVRTRIWRALRDLRKELER